MPTGLRNAVCDECYGGKLVILATGEMQLQHQPGCPYKYREDTFLIDLHLALAEKNPAAYKDTVIDYPKEAKLNPIVYDLFCDGYFRTSSKQKITGREATKRANKINHMLQLVRDAMIQDGNWPMQDQELLQHESK